MELGESARADYNKLVAKRNPNFATEYTRSATLFEPIAKNPDNKKFWDVLKTGGAEWERLRSEDWINTCYSHTDVYVCPYCHCDTVAFPKTPHRKVLHINMKLHSHVWKSTPEDNKSNITEKTWIEDGGDPNTGTWKKAVDEARLQWAWDNQASVPATCLYEGFKLYMCKYDCELDDAWDQRHDGPEADPYRYKVRRTPALGHNFTEWELWQTFEKDGKPVYQFERHCTQCGETQTKVTYDKAGKNPVDVVEKVTLNKKSVTLKKGETFQITVKTTPVVAEKITYKSADKKIAKVSSTGLVTAVKKGTVKITVTADGVKATLKVKVK
jgi:hypothetical protein